MDLEAVEESAVRSSHQLTCVSCGQPLGGKFCAACGEQRFDHHSLSLGHFAEHAFEAFTHVDSAVFRTLRALVLAPGQLTADWARGKRKPYLAPVQLFLIMNVLFFIAQSLNNWNTLTTNLIVHVGWSEHQEIAKPMVKARLVERKIDFKQYAAEFDPKARIQAKSLVIAMVPLFALGTALIAIRARRYFTEHLVFGIHFYSFFLLYVAVSTSLTIVALKLWVKFAPEPSVVTLDAVVSSVGLGILVTYLTVATRKAYGFGWVGSILSGLVLALLMQRILMLYRFALFLLTFYTT